MSYESIKQSTTTESNPAILKTSPMKILVPTDFGKYAEYAKETAISIAIKRNAEIHFYHSADIPDDWEDLSAEERYLDDANKKIAIRTGKKLEHLRLDCERKGIKSEVHYTGGKFLDNIHEILDKIKFDLIVMGSHGAASKEEWFIGTKTQKVIRKFHVPTLVVKCAPSNDNYDEVVYASELLTRDEDGFRHFLDFIKLYEPKVVHLLMVNTGSFFNQPSFLVKESFKRFKSIAAEYNCQTHFYSDINIEAGIRHFSQEHKIDLIGISNLYSNKFKRIFQGSVVEMVVNHSDAPVYVVDYEK